eukprot:g7590.t1
MDVEDANVEREIARCGNGVASRASTFETRCYENVLGCEQQIQSSALFRDAELVDSPNEAKTFWLPADACPTTSLELLAKAIFDVHAKGCRQHHTCPAAAKRETGLGGDEILDTTAVAADSPSSCTERGAEWWVQRREEGHHTSLGMPFHWDKDEHMLDLKGEVLCPAVSTVTYLTDVGAPTVVLESRVPDTGAMEDGDIERVFVSYPELLKHLAFDGGFLHGVPEELIRTEDKGEGYGISTDQVEGGGTRNCRRSSTTTSPSVGSPRRKRGRMRVTLLVNVWLSHKPEGVEALPADLAATLSSRSASPSPLFRFDRPVAFFPMSIENESEALTRRQEADGVSLGEAEVPTMVIVAPLGPAISLELRAPRPDSLSVGRLKALHSFALSCRQGRLARIIARHHGGASGVSEVDYATIEEGSMDEERCERKGGGLVQGDAGREVDTEAGRVSRKKRKKSTF